MEGPKDKYAGHSWILRRETTRRRNWPRGETVQWRTAEPVVVLVSASVIEQLTHYRSRYAQESRGDAEPFRHTEHFQPEQKLPSEYSTDLFTEVRGVGGSDQVMSPVYTRVQKGRRNPIRYVFGIRFK